MEAGSAVSYYLQSVTVHNYGTDRKVFKENEQSINDFQISAILGVGLNYQLNNKTQLFLQPPEKPINFEKDGQKNEEKKTKEEDLKSKIINKKGF